MLIVISPENNLKNEIANLHALFAEGLAVFHLRKPNHSIEDWRNYLNLVDKKYHNRIVLHNHFDLCKEYKVKGVHFKEGNRIGDIEIENSVQNYLDMGLTVSSSFHSKIDIAKCNATFTYHFLSPVFNSISKVGYKGKGFDVNASNKTTIALGGITNENIPEAKQLGYNGMAVLGHLWNQGDVISNFKKIKDTYSDTFLAIHA